MRKLDMVQGKLARQGRLGPVARLLPTTAATTLRKSQDPPLVIDGPFAETKEQLLGFYIVECAGLDEALETAQELAAANPGGAYELRPVGLSPARRRQARERLTVGRTWANRMSDLAWIEAALTRPGPRRSARCCAISVTSTPPRRPSGSLPAGR